MTRLVEWTFRELALLRISQELWISLDRALERTLSECMDRASDLPDPRDVEASVAAVHCTGEESVMENKVKVARVFFWTVMSRSSEGYKVMPPERGEAGYCV